nr:hypothetical protein [Tanacetum cinerariifolium]
GVGGLSTWCKKASPPPHASPWLKEGLGTFDVPIYGDGRKVPTASEERFPLLSQKDAPVEEVCTADEVKSNNNIVSQSSRSNLQEQQVDWSYMANEKENHALVVDEEALIEFALMAKSRSKNEVEARLVEFKNQEIKFCEKIRGLEFKVESKDNRIERLTKELEELKKEKEGLDRKLTGLPEFADDTITDYSRPSFSIKSKSSDLQNNDSSVSEKGDSLESIVKPSVKYAEMYRNTSKSPKFDHLAYDCGVWVEQGKTRKKNNYTHKSRSPRIVSYKTDRTPAAVNRTHMNDAQPNRTYFSKPAHSYVSRPFQRKSAVKTQFKVPRVSTVNRKFPTINRKVPTGNSKVSTADVGDKGKAGNSQNVIDDKGYWDSGCSRHMTGNISYLSDYEPYDGGYVSFRQGGGKITSKGVIKTGIKREFSNARTSQQNGVAERRNRTLIEAARTIGNSNPTATSTNHPADHMETLTVESPIPTVRSPIPIAYLDDSPEPSSDTKLILKRVIIQDDTTSLNNILNLSNRFEDILGVTTNTNDSNGVEADLGIMEYNISASPTPTFRIHKDHPKSQIIDVRSANTPMDKENPWGKDETGKDVDLHLYRSMIGSLMYLTASRPDIMFDVCACARHQVTPKECHLHAVKRIFRYLKGHPKLGLWYPKESPFDLVAYSDSDYGGATEDRKSTTRGSASGYGQVLWIQNQLLDYGGCSRHMTGNISYLSEYEPYDGGYVSFGQGRGKITGKVYQMNVKSAFLYGTIDEEVYVMQPCGFQDPEFPDRLCREFKALMQDKFQMSAMGELNFFLGLQVLQKKDDIFLSQDKYIGDILKKFGYSDVR